MSKLGHQALPFPPVAEHKVAAVRVIVQPPEGGQLTRDRPHGHHLKELPQNRSVSGFDPRPEGRHSGQLGRRAILLPLPPIAIAARRKVMITTAASASTRGPCWATCLAGLRRAGGSPSDNAHSRAHAALQLRKDL